MWRGDTKREHAIGKTAPTELLDAGLPQTFNVKTALSVEHTKEKCNKMRYAWYKTDEDKTTENKYSSEILTRSNLSVTANKIDIKAKNKKTLSRMEGSVCFLVLAPLTLHSFSFLLIYSFLFLSAFYEYFLLLWLLNVRVFQSLELDSLFLTIFSLSLTSFIQIQDFIRSCQTLFHKCYFILHINQQYMRIQVTVVQILANIWWCCSSQN